MKSFLLKIIILSLIFVGFFKYKTEILNRAKPVMDHYRNIISSVLPNSNNSIAGPCDEPIYYNLGIIDAKFNLEDKYVLAALIEAESVWEKAINKNLFEYNQNQENPMKINFLYDYRQEASNTMAKIGIKVEQTQDSYNEVKAKYFSLKQEYYSLKITYDKKLSSFNKKNKDLQAQINLWNSKGGAPKEEYDKLIKIQQELTKEFNEISLLGQKINTLVIDVNSLATTLNSLANALNINVGEYNKIGQSLGTSYEEGLYKSNGLTSSIDIYEFKNHDQLVKILTHELGHALGFEHVEDTKAVMYKINNSNSLVLSQSDISLLNTKCSLGINIAK